MSNFPLVVSTAILILTYVAIGTGKIPASVVALVSASSVLLLKLIPAHEAFAAIDLNVIFLLSGLMVMVNITKKTGVFQWIAIKAAKSVGGKPLPLLIVLSVVTAFTSAFINNVTTVLLIGPVTLLITRELRLNPTPFMISEALTANIGGAATLIGDPSNTMIGAAAHFTFADFITHQAPCILIILGVYCIMLWLFFGDSLKTSPELTARIMKMDEKKAITDKLLLYKCLFVITCVIIGFLLSGTTYDYVVGVIALAGTSLLLLLQGGSPEESIREIDWETIIFISGLFIVVKSSEKSGLISILANNLINLTQGKPAMTAVVIVWGSAFLSAFINNTPYVATMIPLIHALPASVNINGSLWWALSLGACLGGNGTLVGASANMIVAGFSGKSGYPISFMRFTKIGVPMMIGTVFVASVYIWLRYY